MTVRVQEFTAGANERRILTSMIVSRKALSRLLPVWHGDDFGSPWANEIAAWCVDHYKRYGKAPRGHVAEYYAEWAARQPDRAKAEAVAQFLSALSGEYERLAREDNSSYSVDLAARHFTLVKQRRLKEALEGALVQEDTARADELLAAYRKVEAGDAADLDFFHDDRALAVALDPRRNETVVKYRGALGEFLGPDAFVRDSFVGFCAPEGRGKSWMLLDVTWQALRCRKRVGFITVGDMSSHKVMQRFLMRVSGQPLRPRTVAKPTRITITGRYDCSLETEQLTFPEPLDIVKAMAARDRFMRRKLNTDGEYFKIRSYPSWGIGVDGIRGVIDQWKSRDWVPDVVVIDYADVLALPAGRSDNRDKINEVWARLRGLSTELHVCLVTATQTNRVSYGVPLILPEHMGEDKRKLAHVNLMLGINQTPTEKRQQVYRLNILKLREDEFSPYRCVWLAGCLSLGHPTILTALRPRAEEDQLADDTSEPTRNGRPRQRSL